MTKPLSGNCRRSSRSALISSPRSGCTDGLPFLTRRTCSEADRPNSTWHHSRSQISCARRPCWKAIRIRVAPVTVCARPAPSFQSRARKHLQPYLVRRPPLESDRHQQLPWQLRRMPFTASLACSSIGKANATGRSFRAACANGRVHRSVNGYRCACTGLPFFPSNARSGPRLMASR
jgi:hypothetical protein